MVDTVAILVGLIANVIVLSPVLWLSGRALVGTDKAKFMDAIWIVVLGSVIGAVFQFAALGLVGTIIMVIVWLALIKHFFDSSWLMALAIAIIAIIIYIVIVAVLAVLFGVALLGAGFFL
ncbi:MAG: hypothetical protein NWF04_03470 [Candidatus Bathyarchaeota archaeon]|nr:hypothetical protein [Candidatus Bathyarchaeota archaeon]